MEGGRLVAWGTPEEVAGSDRSRTAPYLKRYLRQHR
jgi:excinuclease UvrABC ATPase subunit